MIFLWRFYMKNGKLFLLFTALIVANSHSHAMQQRIIRHLPGVGKFISGFLTLIGPVSDKLFGYDNKFTHKKLDSLPDMPQEAQQFIEPIIKQCCPEANNIRYKIADRWNVYHSSIGTVISCCQEEMKQLQDALQSNDHEQLALHKNTIKHEAGHMVHNHREKKYNLDIGTALGSHVAVNTALNGVSKKFFPITTFARGITWCGVHVASTAIKFPLWYYGVQPSSAAWYRHYQEAEADGFSAQNADSREN